MKKLLIASLTLLSACTSTVRPPQIDAAALASAAHMQPHTITAAPFTLLSYERIAQTGKTTHVYIEGDGQAWVRKNRASTDPTPHTPVALMLAAKDDTPNVIYLARPCQYPSLTGDKTCAQKYWTSHRFAPEVIRATNAALDDMKARYGITGFSLVGFSGGANIAALIAASRSDVISLRTVAGNMDHVMLHTLHDVSQTPASLNAKDIAPAIRHLPQHHFIGAADTLVTPDILASFVKASGKSTCIRSTIVPGASHTQGWDAKWPELLQLPATCYADK